MGWKTPEQKKAYQADWYAKNKERLVEKSRARNVEKRVEISHQKRDYYLRNKDTILAKAKAREAQLKADGLLKNKYLMRDFGITQADFDAMIDGQSGACAICLVKFAETPAVDHCHSGGHVRGLLCRGCNTGLGSFKDNTQSMLNAIKYLEERNG